MTKKSKKSSHSSSGTNPKTSSRSKTANVARDSTNSPQPPQPSPPQPPLNPFYIEQPPSTSSAATKNQSWKGDYNWNNDGDEADDDEYEDEYTEQAQGLLPYSSSSSNNPHAMMSHHDAMRHQQQPRRRERRQLRESRWSRSEDDGFWKVRACVLCLVLPLLVAIVWSTLFSSSFDGRTNVDTNHINTNDSSSSNRRRTPAPSSMQQPKASTRRPQPAPIRAAPKDAVTKRTASDRPASPVTTTTAAVMSPTTTPDRINTVTEVTATLVPSLQHKPRQHQRTRRPTGSNVVTDATMLTTPLPVQSPKPMKATHEDDDDTDDDGTEIDSDDDTNDDTDESETTDETTPAESPNVSQAKQSGTTLVVLGERHSGVDWLLATLTKCYPSVKVSSGLKQVRSAYWFQHHSTNNATTTVITTPPRNQRALDTNRSSRSTRSSIRNTNVTVVAMVRNPYEWAIDMWLQPLYAPAHFNATVPLSSLRKFLAQPWSLKDVDRGPWMEYVAPLSSDRCQLGFTPHQVTPCLALPTSVNVDREVTVPMYELDSDGQVFANIMKLRAAKIRHVLDEVVVAAPTDVATKRCADSLTMGCHGVVVVPFETGLDESILSVIDAALGQVATCRPIEMSTGDSTDAAWWLPVAPPRTNDPSLVKQLQSSKFKKWMLEHVSWRDEVRIGYFPAEK